MALVEYLRLNPFATDEQLAEQFGVSVATIRLDRSALHIPEVRERIREMATHRQDDLRSLNEAEVVGRIVALQLNRSAVSELIVQPAHVFARTGIVRGHILFGQVNSLAVAVMDADIALTAKAELRFYRPVRLGETLVARVDVIGEQGDVVKCRAISRVGRTTVLDGVIWVQRDPESVPNHLLVEAEAEL